MINWTRTTDGVGAWRLAVCVMVGLMLAGCGGSPGDLGTTASNRGATPDECKREGYPCTWNEVDPSIAVETEYIGEVAGLMGFGGATPEEVTAFLLAQTNVETAIINGSGIRYRLTGGRPAWIFIEDELAHHRGRIDPDVRDAGVPAPVAERAPDGRRLTNRAADLARRWLGPVSLQAATQGAMVDDQGVAAEEPGTGKRALILSPFEHEFPGTGSEIAARTRVIRDYRTENDGEVVYHADLDADVPNPVGPGLPGLPAGAVVPSGNVEFEDFFGWDAYNLVILASHGTEHYCLSIPPIGGAPRRSGQDPDGPRVQEDQCPLIWAGRAKQESYGHHMGVEIITFTGWNYLPHPGLSSTEATWCVAQLAAREEARRQGGQYPPEPQTAGGKPCRVPTGSRDVKRLALWTSFFDNAYPNGLNNVIVMLAACRSGINNYLLDILAPQGNRNVVVLGFDDTVDAGHGFAVAKELVEQIDNGLHSTALIAKLKELDQTQHLVGVSLDLGDEPLPAEPAEVVDAATTATYGRDVVLLVDPATGKELRDGATLRVRGVPDDDVEDELSVFARILGVTEPQRLPDVRLQVDVDDSEPPNDGYEPDRPVGTTDYQFDGPVALGRDHQDDERVDLRIRTTLPGGQRSTWSYEDILLRSYPCSFTATVSGGPYSGRHEGPATRLGNGIVLADVATDWEARVGLPSTEVGEYVVELEVLAADLPGGTGPTRWWASTDTPDGHATIAVTKAEPDGAAVSGTVTGHLGWRAPEVGYEYLDVEIEFHVVPFSVRPGSPHRVCREVWEDRADSGGE